MAGQHCLAIAASAFLVGCAKLGISPGPEVLGRCLEVALREGRSQEVANTAWALAVLQVSSLGSGPSSLHLVPVATPGSHHLQIQVVYC